MVALRINGAESPVRVDSHSRFTDFVELVKSMIDPEHMITSIVIDGVEPSEEDWQGKMNKWETSVFEVQTDTPEQFVRERLGCASDVLRSIYMVCRDARKAFQAGNMQGGNQILSRAVTMMKGFFDWYGAMLQLTPPEKRAEYDINPQVKELVEICKRICQQQLYQSWWALGESMEKELEPKLDKLEDFCRKFEIAA